MTDLQIVIKQLADAAGNGITEDDVIHHLHDNNWYGVKPKQSGGKFLLTKPQIQTIKKGMQAFLDYGYVGGTSATLISMLEGKYPSTVAWLKKYMKLEKPAEPIIFHVSDFLLFHLKKELLFYSDDEAETLVRHAAEELQKGHGDYLVNFMSWMKLKTRVVYSREFVMAPRYEMTDQTSPYDLEEYAELIYCLVCEEHIKEADMYRKAAESKNYTDTWLFIAMHFICALRVTDMERIFHPQLPSSPEETLHQIADGTFSDNDARIVLLSITSHLSAFNLYPSKTERFGVTESVKVDIPENCEALYGRLFACAEAHRQMIESDEPIIRKITTYSQIKRYMGDEIGDLFVERDFLPRAATKNFMQSIFVYADASLGRDPEDPHLYGRILAALARSHKTGLQRFLSTTLIYLKNARLSELDPQFVAFELLNRGVLSSVVSMLLKMLTDNQYGDLPAKSQTELIRSLGMRPYEVDTLIGCVDTARKQAEEALQMSFETNVDVMTALQMIVTGSAYSKQPEYQCLRRAFHQDCPYRDRKTCIGCEHEIPSRSALFLLIEEYNRMSSLIHKVDSPQEKAKYRSILTEVILPRMAEMLQTLKVQYGDDVFREYEELIKENTYA